MSKLTRSLALSLPFFAITFATACEPVEPPLTLMPLANGNYEMIVHDFEAIECPGVVFDDEVFGTVFMTRLEASGDRVSFDLEGIELEGRRDSNTISLAWNEGDRPVDVGTTDDADVSEDAAMMFTVMPNEDVDVGRPDFRPDIGAKLEIVSHDALTGSIFLEGPAGFDFCSIRLDVELDFVGEDDRKDTPAPRPEDDEPELDY